MVGYVSILILAFLGALNAVAADFQDIVYVNENGTAFYISVSPSDCDKDPDYKGAGYKCFLKVDKDDLARGVIKATFNGKKALVPAYYVTPGTILGEEPKGSKDPPDLISFPSAGNDKNDKPLGADSVLFYDITDKNPFTGKADKMMPEMDLSGEVNDTVDAGATMLGALVTGQEGYAFTASNKQIGGLPTYSNRFIRYIFVSDTVPSNSGAGDGLPEPRLLLPLGVLVVAWFTRRNHRSQVM